MARMVGYATVVVLMLAGWTALNAAVAWAYLAAALAFEALARRQDGGARPPPGGGG